MESESDGGEQCQEVLSEAEDTYLVIWFGQEAVADDLVLGYVEWYFSSRL